MRSQAISFNQLNEVEGVQNEQQRSQNWSLRHTRRVMSDRRALRWPYCVRPTRYVVVNNLLSVSLYTLSTNELVVIGNMLSVSLCTVFTNELVVGNILSVSVHYPTRRCRWFDNFRSVSLINFASLHFDVSIQEIPDNFNFFKCPKLSSLCALDGLCSPGGKSSEWSENAVTTFARMTNNTRMLMKVWFLMLHFTDWLCKTYVMLQCLKWWHVYNKSIDVVWAGWRNLA